MSDRKFHAFFETAGPGRLLFYKYFEGDLLYLVGKTHKEYKCASAPIQKLEKGKWHHLAATWKQGEARVYIDGKAYGRMPVDVPTRVGNVFQIGDRPCNIPRPGGRKTLIDEVYIYRRALRPSEVRRLYERTLTELPRGYQVPRITITPCPRTPQMDGRIQPGEWDTASMVTGFVENVGREFCRRQTTIRLTYDDERLYLAFQSPLPAGRQLLATEKSRDSHVWNDDAIEIFLSPDRERYVQFIGNSIGAIYDSKGKDQPKWDANWEYHCQVADDLWTAEVSVPFKDLGVGRPADGDTWGLNLCRDWQNPRQWTTWSRAADFHRVEHFGELVFRRRAPTLALGSCGRLWAGQLDLALVLANPSHEPVTAKLEVTVTSALDKVYEVVRPVKLEPGQAVSVPVKRDLIGTEADTLRVRVTDPSGKVQHYRSVIPFSVSPPMEIRVEPWPSRGICTVIVDLNGLRESPKSPSVLVELVAKDGGRTLSHAVISRLDHLVGRVDVPIDKAKPGSYLVCATARDGLGRTLATVRQPFDKPADPSWRNSRVGIVEGVLPPWTPMNAKQTADGRIVVDCWGRTYRFDKSLLPEQIIARDAPLLAAPVTVIVELQGRALRLDHTAIKLTRATEAEVHLEGEQSVGPLQLRGRTRMEFDGLAVFDLELKPSQPTRVDRLTLEIPLRASRAGYRHVPAWGTRGGGGSGGIAREDGWTWERSFVHYLWVGDEDRGLTWFCETDADWHVTDAKHAIRMVRRGDAVCLTCTVIDNPVMLDRPYKFVFGLQATPVKPMPKGWRGWGLGRNIAILWTTPATTKHFGYPEVPDPAAYKKRIDGYHKRDMAVAPYSLLSMLSVNSPEWGYWGHEWNIPGEIDAAAGDVRQFGCPIRGACPTCKDWQDFIVTKNLEFVTKNNLDGLYHDHSQPKPCRSRCHGCAPGRIPILAWRQLYKRIYAMLKGLDRPTYMIQHMSGSCCTPVLGFCDGYVTGEHGYASGRVKDDYLDLMTLDSFKAQGMGRQWGIVPMWLPMFKGEHAKVPANTERMMSIMLLHDASTIWLAHCHQPTVQRIWEALDGWGLAEDDVEFVGYWASGDMVATDSDDTLVSLYRRAGSTLLVVANMAKQDRSISVGPNLRRLGLDAATAKGTDLLTGRACKLSDGRIDLEVPWRNFRLVALGAGD